jgi:hypothetical protein
MPASVTLQNSIENRLLFVLNQAQGGGSACCASYSLPASAYFLMDGER